MTISETMKRCYEARELPTWGDILSAADEIDRLSRQLAEAQEALESLLCVCDLATHDSYNIYRAVEMAKSKLAQSAAMGTTDGER